MNHPFLSNGHRIFHVLLSGGFFLLLSCQSDPILYDINNGYNYHFHSFQIDPESARRIHPNDSQRIQRALEIYLVSSKTMTEWLKRHQGNEILKSREVVQFAIEPKSRESLRQDVKKRFLLMLKKGLVQEVERLLDLKQMNSNKGSLKSVGYRQICEYLEGKSTYEEMILRAVNATRQLAKRQMTWLRGWKNLNWVSQDLNLSVKQINTKINS